MTFFRPADSALRAHQAAAHNDDPLAQLFRMQLRVYGHNDLVRIKPRNRRPHLFGTNGHEQGVRIDLFEKLRCQGCVQDYFYTGPFCPAGQNLCQFPVFLFEPGRACRMQIAAQPAGFFNQGDFMPSFRGSDGRFHTRGTAAGDQHLFDLLRGFDAEPGLLFLTDHGIDGAAYHLLRFDSAKAFIAAKAGCDIIRLAQQRLHGKIGIRQGFTSDLNDIRLSARDDFLHHGRILNSAYAGDRRLNMFFDLRSQIDIDAMRIEGTGMGPLEHGGIFMVAAGYIDQITFAIDHFGHFHAIFLVQAAFQHVISADPYLNGECGAAGPADSLQGKQEETGPVLQRAAEFIGPLIPCG